MTVALLAYAVVRHINQITSSNKWDNESDCLIVWGYRAHILLRPLKYYRSYRNSSYKVRYQRKLQYRLIRRYEVRHKEGNIHFYIWAKKFI